MRIVLIGRFYTDGYYRPNDSFENMFRRVATSSALLSVETAKAFCNDVTDCDDIELYGFYLSTVGDRGACCSITRDFLDEVATGFDVNARHKHRLMEIFDICESINGVVDGISKDTIHEARKIPIRADRRWRTGNDCDNFEIYLHAASDEE